MYARDFDTEAAAATWKQQANCAGLETALFFPSQGESSSEAKAVCAACAVRAECLEYALVNREIFGVWGGKSERQRRRIRDARRVAAATLLPPPGDRLCRVADCGRKAVPGSDLCTGHRNRFYTKGDVLVDVPLRARKRRVAPGGPGRGGGMTVPCTHGFPSPASCVECMYDGNLEPPPAPVSDAERDGPNIVAKYDTHCVGCNLAIHVGQTICRMTHGAYEHARHHGGPA